MGLISTNQPSGLALCANVPRGLAVLVATRARELGFTVRSVRSACKSRSLHRARLQIAAEARELDYSFPEIGRALNRDHSTVLKNLRRVAK